MTDEDRVKLADLSMRALDTILADYGETAELTCASIVFEVKVDADRPEEEWVYHVNYKSLPGVSPHHVAGLMQSMADWLTSPADTDE